MYCSRTDIFPLSTRKWNIRKRKVKRGTTRTFSCYSFDSGVDRLLSWLILPSFSLSSSNAQQPRCSSSFFLQVSTTTDSDSFTHLRSASRPHRPRGYGPFHARRARTRPLGYPLLAAIRKAPDRRGALPPQPDRVQRGDCEARRYQ